MTTLLLVRHGESEANRSNTFAGQIDPDLLSHGVLQAECTAKYIASNFSVDKIYSSDLRRAYKTAQCLSDLIDEEIVIEYGVREIDGGKWEGVYFYDLAKLFPDDFAVWNDDIGSSVCTGGESVRDFSVRIMSALEKIAAMNEGKTVAVYTHATPIRVAMTMIQHGSIDHMKNINWVSNASVTELFYENGNFRLGRANIDAHLGENITALPDKI